MGRDRLNQWGLLFLPVLANIFMNWFQENFFEKVNNIF